VLCPAAVRHAFDHFAKAYWMTRNPAPKAVVDAVLKKSLDAGDYQSALAAASGEYWMAISASGPSATWARQYRFCASLFA